MPKSRLIWRVAGAAMASVGAVASCPSRAAAQAVVLAPATMPRVGAIDERYQSYNVEMLEVTGGRFWRPYGPALDSEIRQPAPPAPAGDTPVGMNPALYEYRPPLDLTNPRLRTLASALGPAYVRVSGTWANTTYFPATDEAPASPPPGFGGVLTQPQWKGVIDFSKAVDANIVTSFATGVGTRDASGAWTPEQARRLLDYTNSLGARIAAAEYMNEPTLAMMGGAPMDYDAAAYGRDFKTFRAFAQQAAPDMQILGPGSVGEAATDWAVASGYSDAVLLKTRDLLGASAPARVDAFSYHHYGAVSLRCAAQGHQTTREAALSEEWLARTEKTLAFYKSLRDQFEPDRPFWLTETADAACGGNPWANTFVDTFRYLDQLGRLAKQNVKVIAHNTLVASDYGLLNDRTLEPKPNYWGALLWRRLMASTVLESGVPLRDGLHLYAHCLRGRPGGLALLAINNNPMNGTSITIPSDADVYTLTAERTDSSNIQLNGQDLRLGANSTLPALRSRHIPSGDLDLAARTISFVAIEAANNENCK